MMFGTVDIGTVGMVYLRKVAAVNGLIATECKLMIASQEHTGTEKIWRTKRE